MCNLAIHGKKHFKTWGVSWIYQNTLDFCLTGWKTALCEPKITFFLQGIKEYIVPVGLDGKARVDLVVVGSVAVSEKGKRKPCKLFKWRVLSRSPQCQ